MSQAYTLSSYKSQQQSRRNTAAMPISYYPPRHLPLTPPEYYDAMPSGAKGQSQTMYPSYEQYNYGNTCFMKDTYHHGSQYNWRAQENVRDVRSMMSMPALPRENGWGAIAAPVLPPISAPEQQANFKREHTREAPAQNPKQEKSAGGVAAELDYDMDMMVDFVAQMTTGMWAPFVAKHDLSSADLVRMVQPSGINVEKKFRSYVQSVLTSTRLPAATLLLALHYLSDRIKRRSGRGDFPHRYSNNLVHHLTVALMLASKFLDDNTFQNRSWAEVSHLPVHELNAREMDWLHDIRWHLHVDWEDANGVRVWFAKWDEYNILRAAQKNELNLDQLKLSPISADHRNPPPASMSPAIRDSYYQGSVQSQYRLPAPDIQWPQIRSLSPPSAGPTKASTPEYYNSANATPQYLPSQQHVAQHSAFADQSMMHEGQLVYTRRSPLYGEGYVCELRQRGGHVYAKDKFVGYDYTAQYADQLAVGWCELHRRYNCHPCGSNMMYAQAGLA